MNYNAGRYTGNSRCLDRDWVCKLNTHYDTIYEHTKKALSEPVNPVTSYNFSIYCSFLSITMAPSSRHVRRSVTPANPPLVCFLCGMIIPGAHNHGLSNSDKNSDLLKDSQWKSSGKSDPKHMMVPSHEVEETYLSNYPRIWSRLCRASESSTRRLQEEPTQTF